uniref:Uncharacterized protein n=1 Tax=Arundo donax TaxID=35708 RepID=A0A0A9S4S5_ARUDO
MVAFTYLFELKHLSSIPSVLFCLSFEEVMFPMRCNGEERLH